MSGPSERDPGVTGRSLGQYANALILREVGFGDACARAASGAVPLTYISPNDATICGQRVPKHARYTFDRSTKVSSDRHEQPIYTYAYTYVFVCC